MSDATDMFRAAAPPGLTIRPALPDDIDRLAPFAARVFHDTFAADSDPADMERYLAAAFAPTQLAAEIADPACVFRLAHVDAALVGYLKLRRAAVPACVVGQAPLELSRLYVTREWQGRGIAAALMHAALDYARERGYRTMWLGVWDRNPRARAFYSKWRFREVGEHAFQFGNELQSDLVYARAVDAG